MENIEKGKLISSGKAKSLYESSNPDYYFMHYRDDTSAFDGVKHLCSKENESAHITFNACILDFLNPNVVLTFLET